MKRPKKIGGPPKTPDLKEAVEIIAIIVHYSEHYGKFNILLGESEMCVEIESKRN